ncbi:MAG TPA: SRPBCC family protein [Allosphingosinicella sp.]|nr:SRPBCC family protein [Allosphingosinicella sp.]
MVQNNNNFGEGAGTTTRSGGSTTSGSTTSGSTTSGTAASGSTASGPTGRSGFETSGGRGGYDYGSQYSSYDSGSREVVLAERSRSQPSTATVIGAAIAGAIAGGAIPFMLSGRSSSSGSRRESQVAEESVTINRPARELYNFWRDFTNFPQFMDNIESVTKLDDRRSHWVIKAPAGTTVEFDSRITEDVPGRLIAWQSEEGASVPNRGRVEFIEGSTGGTTTVRTWISYDPPAGAAGRLVAKLFQREPGTQARQDLARFKQLMESGRVTG